MDVQPAPNVETAVGGTTAQPATSTSNAAPSVQGVTPQSPDSAKASDPGSGIAPAISKLFGAGVPHPATLNVSYRVEGNDVVTVFSDPKTGKEIAQFPPELLLGLAKFFDQHAGVTFDKNA